MTAREFMQFFGTDICRNAFQPIWVNACLNKIKREKSQLIIIADVRFAMKLRLLRKLVVNWLDS